MNMTSEQINRLKYLADDVDFAKFDKDLASELRQAADTIEALSAKLQTENMKRNKILKEIREKAQELSNQHWGDDERHLIGKGIQCMCVQAENIVKANTERLAEDCGGWIYCEDGKNFPEGEDVKVIVSAVWDGYEYTTESYFYHGKFYNKPYYQISAGEIYESHTGDKVVAWRKFPEPYHEP